MKSKNLRFRDQRGLTLVELMVALAIGSFLMVGTIQIYNQSRQAFVVNESIARVQETAQFAMDTLEADLRMASNWGRTSRSLDITGRAELGDPNPESLTTLPTACGNTWANDLAVPIDGNNNGYNLPCAATGGAIANSDIITIRRASVAAVAPAVAPAPARLQVQTIRTNGQIIEDGVVPGEYLPPANSTTHDLIVTSYYVSPSSQLIGGVPTLRRKRLVAGPTINDEEVAPGVENIQIQLGIDVNADNTVDRYVNPGDQIYIPGSALYIPGAQVITARVWMIVRGFDFESGVQGKRYQPGDVDLGVLNDNFRRMQVTKTILLRNSRT